MSTATELLVRYLRQRQELGETELICTGCPPLAGVAERARPARSKPGTVSGAPAIAQRRLPRPDITASPAPGGQEATGRIARYSVLRDDALPADLLVLLAPLQGEAEGRSGFEQLPDEIRELLGRLFTAVGLSLRETAFWTLPAGSGDPAPTPPAAGEEIRAGIGEHPPRAILACGSEATRILLGSDEAIGALRGASLAFEGVPVIATHAPAAILRQSSWIRPVWHDLQRLRSLLEPLQDGAALLSGS